jgi:hypothetical protein
MKDIKSYAIGLLTCGYLFGGIFDNVENPNGKPFTLGIAYSFEHYEASERLLGWADSLIAPGDYYHNKRWKFVLPVSFWLTLTYEQYLDRSEKYVPMPVINPIAPFPGGRYMTDVGTVVSYGAELHLPLYKLWKR